MNAVGRALSAKEEPSKGTMIKRAMFLPFVDEVGNAFREQLEGKDRASSSDGASPYPAAASSPV
jgi:hypothetical protein